MNCKACSKDSRPSENDDCFEKALEELKKHYVYYKNALQQRELELVQVKERNEKLNKALLLLQKSQRPAKRFKSQHKNDFWLENNSCQEDCVSSDLSLTDDEPNGATNLNIALNSDQLFNTSALSQTKSDVSIASCSEIAQTPWAKESPKRNKQHDTMRISKGRKYKTIDRSKSEWHTKERTSPAEMSWATKFLQGTKTKVSDENVSGEGKKTANKKLCLSLKKTNPAKIKQTLLPFNKSRDTSFRESEIGEDIIHATPVILNKNSKSSRSWAHRSGNNCSSTSTNIADETMLKDDSNKSLDDIVFDFSPSKKTDLNLNSNKTMEPKHLKFDGDGSKDCVALPKEDSRIPTDKTDTSSVVILTPGTQDIIFVDDTDIDTMELLDDVMKPDCTDNLEILKKYESKCVKSKQTNMQIDLFKKPSNKPKAETKNNSSTTIKKEKNTQESLEEQNSKKKEFEREKPSCSKNNNDTKLGTKQQNPLISSDEPDTEDEDFMPKPFIIKQETERSKPANQLSVKQRFNIDCEDCEKLINFLDKRLTDTQIQQHLDKCKRHNNPELMRQNTPNDFWNPFILSFQADDPRNEILIDNRFKDNKK